MLENITSFIISITQCLGNYGGWMIFFISRIIFESTASSFLNLRYIYPHPYKREESYMREYTISSTHIFWEIIVTPSFFFAELIERRIWIRYRDRKYLSCIILVLGIEMLENPDGLCGPTRLRYGSKDYFFSCIDRLCQIRIHILYIVGIDGIERNKFFRLRISHPECIEYSKGSQIGSTDTYEYEYICIHDFSGYLEKTRIIRKWEWCIGCRIWIDRFYL